MAYLMDIQTVCDEYKCGKRATKELYHWQNRKLGIYCATHANKRLKIEQEYETRVTA